MLLSTSLFHTQLSLHFRLWHLKSGWKGIQWISQNLLRIYPEFTQKSSRNHPGFIQNLPRICPEFTQNLPRIHPEFIQNSSSINPEFTQNSSRICTEFTQNISRNLPRDFVPILQQTCLNMLTHIFISKKSLINGLK